MPMGFNELDRKTRVAGWCSGWEREGTLATAGGRCKLLLPAPVSSSLLSSAPRAKLQCKN